MIDPTEKSAAGRSPQQRGDESKMSGAELRLYFVLKRALASSSLLVHKESSVNHFRHM